MASAIFRLEPCTRSWYRAALSDMRLFGLPVTTTSTRRTFAEQFALFKLFAEGRSRFPAVRPGTSTHELGIAVDLVPTRPKDLPDVVQVMVEHGFKWAGPRDSVHFTYQKGFRVGVLQTDVRTVLFGC